MGWRRDEMWFDVDVAWFREVSGGSSPALMLRAPVFGTEPWQAIDVPDGLAASRQRRAELRRRRNVRRVRAAALVVTPAVLLPVGAKRLGVGSAGSALQEDPPSLVGEAPLPRPAEATAPRVATFPKIHWHRATSHGLWYSGSLSAGTQLPVEGRDWVTWNPVDDHVPNQPHRLYGHEQTIRTVVSVLAAYRAANPRAPRVVVGDLSFRGGGPMELHRSHQNGLDVDIYYPRRDRRLLAPRSPSQIDRVLAQDLLDRFVAAGAQVAFVGYSMHLHGPSEVVVPYPNHGDHMHVRFPRPGG